MVGQWAPLGCMPMHPADGGQSIGKGAPKWEQGGSSMGWRVEASVHLVDQGEAQL